MTGRLSDWETRLAEYLVTAAASVRAGERNLCALFAAGAVEAITGENPATPFKRKYSETAKVLEQTIDGLFPDRQPMVAQRGDLAWYDGSVGVVVGSVALFVGEDDTGAKALVRINRSDWVKVWGVGHG